MMDRETVFACCVMLLLLAIGDAERDAVSVLRI